MTPNSGALVRLALLLIAGVFCILPQAQADKDKDVNHWLMKMNDAPLKLDYQGTFIYVQENQVEVMRVVHQSSQGIVRERVYSLNGSPREIIRDAEQVWCFLPEKKMGVHEYRQVTNNSFPHILSKRLTKLGTNYRITLGKEGRVADRSARQILIVAKDKYRYGLNLWADRETGLLLQAALIDTDEAQIEQYMFTDLRVGLPIPEKDLQPMTPKEQLVWFGPNDRGRPDIRGDVKWAVRELPDGFMLSRKIKRLSPTRKKMIEHLVYSDGLAAVSIFVEKMGDSSVKPINGLSRMGAVHAYGTLVDGYQITVVGEVPAKTVNMIAMSVTKTE